MKPTERGHLYGGPVLPGVPIRYEGATAVIIATGPSLTADQIMQCRYYHERNKLVVLGVNDAYRICDFLDYLYAADWRWIEYHKGKIQARLKRGFCFTTPEKGRKKGFVNLLQVKVPLLLVQMHQPLVSLHLNRIKK